MLYVQDRSERSYKLQQDRDKENFSNGENSSSTGDTTWEVAYKKQTNPNHTHKQTNKNPKQTTNNKTNNYN